MRQAHLNIAAMQRQRQLNERALVQCVERNGGQYPLAWLGRGVHRCHGRWQRRSGGCKLSGGRKLNGGRKLSGCPPSTVVSSLSRITQRALCARDGRGACGGACWLRRWCALGLPRAVGHCMQECRMQLRKHCE